MKEDREFWSHRTFTPATERDSWSYFAVTLVAVVALPLACGGITGAIRLFGGFTLVGFALHLTYWRDRWVRGLRPYFFGRELQAMLGLLGVGAASALLGCYLIVDGLVA
jgi:hypothetical protein